MIAFGTHNSKVAYDRPAIRRIAASGSAPFDQQPRFYESPELNGRAAFTLVELLVTIAIISILATALLGAASLAGGTAREARTKARILRIHPLLMEHLDTYKNRRVELSDSWSISDINTAVPPYDDTANSNSWYQDPRLPTVRRLAATRELMKMEIPDRWSDVWLDTIPANVSVINSAIATKTHPAPKFLAERSGLNNVYLRKLGQVASGTTREKLLENQGAECLYLVIMNATADGEARSLFSEHTIGDTDGDGAPEFIDGWGNPIEFFRWAPKLLSDLQINGDDIVKILVIPDLVAAKEILDSDPDPFDIYRVGQTEFPPSTNPLAPRGFRLVPLIYSAGPDEEYGLTGGPDDTSIWSNFENRFSDPYYFDTPPDPFNNAILLGRTINESSHVDNITNHLIVGN